MSRISVLLAAAAVAALVVPASAGAPPVNAFGLLVAPQGGKTSLHQWGGMDDQFAVNPDGEVAPTRTPRSAAEATAQSQDEGDDADDPDTGHDDEVLAI